MHFQSEIFSRIPGTSIRELVWSAFSINRAGGVSASFRGRFQADPTFVITPLESTRAEVKRRTFQYLGGMLRVLLPSWNLRGSG